MRLLLTLMVFGALLTSCTENSSFKLEGETNVFKQNEPEFASKIDILWVIDNSGSMASSQQNLAKNFDSFINEFTDRGLDFQMAVATTEAYKDYFLDNGDPQRTFSLLRDGNPTDGKNGFSIVHRKTPDLRPVFLENILQGTAGSGDERPFQSIVATLENINNEDFLRPNSFLAVVIVSDEDDFSHEEETSIGGQYSNPNLIDVGAYYNYLDSLTRGDATLPRFSVSSILVPDQACLDELMVESSGQKIGYRLIDLVEMTDGIIGNICDDFAGALTSISGKILELATQFPLNRDPDVRTIRVYVAGQEIEQSKLNGWSYDSLSNAIRFHGSAIPSQGATIKVDYTPRTAKP